MDNIDEILIGALEGALYAASTSYGAYISHMLYPSATGLLLTIKSYAVATGIIAFGGVVGGATFYSMEVSAGLREYNSNEFVDYVAQTTVKSVANYAIGVIGFQENTVFRTYLKIGVLEYLYGECGG